MSVISAIRPQHLCQFLKYEDRWQKQRDRAGAVLAEGFDYWDKFQSVRPLIFMASAVGAVFGGYMWWKRGISRKSKVRSVEVNVLYPVSTLTFAAIAWITRPGGYLDPNRYMEIAPEQLPPAPPAAPGQQQPPVAPPPSQQTPEQVAIQNPVLGWIDQKAAEFRARDPRFADKAIMRFLRVPGINGAWQELPPQARVLVECGRG